MRKTLLTSLLAPVAFAALLGNAHAFSGGAHDGHYTYWFEQAQSLEIRSLMADGDVNLSGLEYLGYVADKGFKVVSHFELIPVAGTGNARMLNGVQWLVNTLPSLALTITGGSIQLGGEIDVGGGQILLASRGDESLSNPLFFAPPVFRDKPEQAPVEQFQGWYGGADISLGPVEPIQNVEIVFEYFQFDEAAPPGASFPLDTPSLDTVSLVPEPSAYLMLLSGLLVVLKCCVAGSKSRSAG